MLRQMLDELLDYGSDTPSHPTGGPSGASFRIPTIAPLNREQPRHVGWIEPRAVIEDVKMAGSEPAQFDFGACIGGVVDQLL
jgi:hypothetical protein